LCERNSPANFSFHVESKFKASSKQSFQRGKFPVGNLTNQKLLTIQFSSRAFDVLLDMNGWEVQCEAQKEISF
jgi:hypothetical protein